MLGHLLFEARVGVQPIAFGGFEVLHRGGPAPGKLSPRQAGQVRRGRSTIDQRLLERGNPALQTSDQLLGLEDGVAGQPGFLARTGVGAAILLLWFRPAAFLRLVPAEDEVDVVVDAAGRAARSGRRGRSAS